MKKLLNVFLRKNFDGLFAAQAAGTFNDTLFRTAFAAFITYQAAYTAGDGNASSVLTTALAVYMLPFFLFSVLGGEIADKYSKTSVIRIIKLTEVFTALFAALAFYLKSPYLLICVLFFMGAQGAFFSTVKYSILPQILKRQQLIGANGFMESIRYAAILLGTLLGGLLISTQHLGLNALCSTMILCALIGFLCTYLIDYSKGAAPSIIIHTNIFRSILRNFKVVRRAKPIYLDILAISWFWILGAALLSQLPDLSSNVLHGTDALSNYLLTVFAVGLILGALGCSKLLKGDVSIKYVPLSAVLMSIAMLDLAIVIALFPEGSADITLKTFLTTFTGIRLSLDLFILSVSAGLYIVPLNAMLQASCTDATRSRVIGVSMLLNSAFMVAGSIFSFLLLYLGFGTAAVLAILAAVNLVVALYICALLPDYVVRSVMFFLLNFFYKIKLQGLENYQKAAEEKTIILANNNSFLDPLLIGAFLPDDITFVVDSTIAKRFWVKFFLRFVKHIPVDPTNAIAVKTIIDEIKKGKKMVIFPEGRISTTGGLMKIYPGPAMIAEHSGAKILPLFIQGTQYSRWAYFGRKLRHLPSNVQFTINILPAVNLNLPEDLKGKERRYCAEDRVYDLMCYMKYKSQSADVNLFRGLIEASDLTGRGARALEDIQRKPITFSTLLIASFLLGRKFTKFTKSGEYVGIMLPNANACAVSVFAMMAYGRVPAMINFSSGIKNILSCCRSAVLKTVITSRLVVAKAELQPIVDAMEKNGITVVYLEDIQKTITLADKLRALAQGKFPYRAFKRTNTNPDANLPAVVLFTSGSEGCPKGVVLSHRNIHANKHQMLSFLTFGLQDTFFNALPMFHSFGLVCGLFMPLLSGASVFLYPSPLHYKVVPELIYDRNASVFFGTDTFLAAYAKMAHPYDFYNIKYIGMGGEKLKDETFKIWSEKFGIRILEAYGTTEASPVVTLNTPMHFKRGTVGRIFPGIEYKVVPVDGIEEGGEFVIKGDNIMLGYLKEDKPGVLQPLKDGWYDTGDIVKVDDEGFFSIQGRAKRFAKIAGEMISLSAVENSLLKKWPDYMHAAVHLPDEKRGEQILIYTTHPSLDPKQLQDAMREQGFTDLWIPRRIETVESIPLMGNGKVDYVTLEEMSKKYY